MISKYSDHNLHPWIRLIQQTKFNPALSFPFLSIFFSCDIHSLQCFFFLFSLFISLVHSCLCTSLSICIKNFSQFHLLFTTTTAGLHVCHHHALLITSRSLPPSSPSRSSPSPQVTSLSVSLLLLLSSFYLLL